MRAPLAKASAWAILHKPLSRVSCNGPIRNSCVQLAPARSFTSRRVKLALSRRALRSLTGREDFAPSYGPAPVSQVPVQVDEASDMLHTRIPS